MNIIIVGCGKVGQTLAQQLNEEGNNITVIGDKSRYALIILRNQQAVITQSEIVTGCCDDILIFFEIIFVTLIFCQHVVTCTCKALF